MYIATPTAENMQEVYHMCVYYCIGSADVKLYMVTCLSYCTVQYMVNFKLSRRV
jgi:hypothetical protein